VVPFMKSRELLVIFMLVLAGGLASELISSERTSLSDNRTQIYFQGHVLNVHIANTPKERQRGLMFREELGENEGMLFVYEEEDYRSFWMKNTLIPLDIIFLNAEKEVINVETARPEPNVSDSNLMTYGSERPAKYVLEVNAGFAEDFSVSEGAKFSWKDLR